MPRRGDGAYRGEHGTRDIPGRMWACGFYLIGSTVTPQMGLIIIENSVSRGSQGRNGIGWIFSIRYINLSFISLLNSKNRSSDFTNRSSDLADRSFISFLSSKNRSSDLADRSFISFLCSKNCSSDLVNRS